MIEVTATDAVQESLGKLGPTNPLKMPTDHRSPSGKHAAGRTKPQSPRDKKTKHNRLKRQRQQYMTYVVDQVTLNG